MSVQNLSALSISPTAGAQGAGVNPVTSFTVQCIAVIGKAVRSKGIKGAANFLAPNPD
ncbi:hypothetical protein HDU96_004960 [Phlyctochytrium bullatum]|nr:hypothetical protein HDU96_004960 [Phlyctochytrium bullatum]